MSAKPDELANEIGRIAFCETKPVEAAARIATLEARVRELEALLARADNAMAMRMEDVPIRKIIRAALNPGGPDRAAGDQP